MKIRIILLLAAMMAATTVAWGRSGYENYDFAVKPSGNLIIPAMKGAVLE